MGYPYTVDNKILFVFYERNLWPNEGKVKKGWGG